jgi:hypothetical protein
MLLTRKIPSGFHLMGERIKTSSGRKAKMTGKQVIEQQIERLEFKQLALVGKKHMLEQEALTISRGINNLGVLLSERRRVLEDMRHRERVQQGKRMKRI